MADQENTTAIVTGIMPCSYPQLHEKDEDASGNLCYSIQVLVDVSDKKELAKLKTACENAAVNKFGEKFRDWKAKGVKFHSKKGDPDDPLQAGKVCFSAKSFKKQPRCFDIDNQEIAGSDAIYDKFYPGCEVRLALNFYGSDKGNANTIAVGLNGVMWQGEGERMGGGPDPQDLFAQFATEKKGPADSPFNDDKVKDDEDLNDLFGDDPPF